MDNFVAKNRQTFLEELNANFPDRKDPSKKYSDLIANAEDHLDELIRLTVEKKSWFLYGVDQASQERKRKEKETGRERRQPFSLSYPLPH